MSNKPNAMKLAMYSPAEHHLAVTANYLIPSTGKTRLTRKAKSNDFARLGILAEFSEGYLKIAFKKNTAKHFKRSTMRAALEGRLQQSNVNPEGFTNQGGVICSCNNLEEAKRITRALFSQWMEEEFGTLVHSYYKIREEVIELIRNQNQRKSVAA